MAWDFWRQLIERLSEQVGRNALRPTALHCRSKLPLHRNIPHSDSPLKNTRPKAKWYFSTIGRQGGLR
jgi:hypothetical protein